MAYEQDFTEFMPVTVSWYPLQSRNQYGEQTFAASATSIRCRIEPKVQMVRTATGEERISNATLYLAGSYDIDVRDRLVLPDGIVEIVSVAQHYDDEGLHHTNVYV